MLYDDTTTAAVLAGVAFPTREWTCAQADAVVIHLARIAAKHDCDVQLFAPGDTTTDHGPGTDEVLYCDQMVFGFAVATGTPWDCPLPIHPDGAAATLERLRAIPAAFWHDLRDSSELLTFVDPSKARLWLACWGPLPYANLVAGVPHPKNAKDSVKHKFHSVQDMDQEWLELGVDGVSLGSVEFTDLRELDLSEKAVADWLKKVADLPDPALHLTVRYD